MVKNARSGLSYIAEPLRHLAVPIDSLTLDPSNARKHDQRNLDAIAGSLKRFGQRFPIVVQRQGRVVRAGNGRLIAAKNIGWTHMAALVVDESDVEAVSFSLADNRTSDLSSFDDEALTRLLESLPSEMLEVTGFSSDELQELINELHPPEITEDDVPLPPDQPTARPGDRWLLGDHVLLCGDSSKPEDVDRLLGGAPIHLANTDPPYNVKVEPRSNNAIAAGLSSFTAPKKNTHHQALDLARHPEKSKPTTKQLRAKDRPLANDFVSDEEFDRLLDAWFGNIARVLLPGRGFYIWGGYANCGNYPPVLKAHGLYFSQAIIWDKQHPVLTRKDYMGAHEWCQPADASVLTPHGHVPIASLRDGDRVVSFRRYNSELTGRRGVPVMRAERPYHGPMLRVAVGDRQTWCTPGHIWSVRINPDAGDLWCVYLMRRGRWWRVGKSKLLSTWGFGVKHRLKTEDAEAAWILSVHGSNLEATVHEQVTQAKYGLPTTTWNETYASRRTIDDVTRLYDKLDLNQLERGAMRALADHGRDPLYPFLERSTCRAKVGSRVSLMARACNLIPEVMLVPLPTSEAPGRVPWAPLRSVEREQYDGLVHSLAVPGTEHYVVDGVVTHNCFYGWREGAGHEYFGPNNATDLWAVKKVNPQAMTHLTEKPVELAARAIQYSSRPGENVLDLFGGSGSTLMAAEQTKRRAFLMELDPLYCDVILMRYAAATGIQPTLDGDGRTFEKVMAERLRSVEPERPATCKKPSRRRSA